MSRLLRFKIVVVGASWGGIDAATRIFSELPKNFPVPIVLVQHQRAAVRNRLASLFASKISLKVVAPEHGTELEPGGLFVAPPGYHCLVEKGGSLALALYRPVHYCRPAIDELFFSAGYVYGRGVMAVLLTGANEDGATGMQYIKRRGGMTVAQDPADSESPIMPQSAIDMGGVDEVLPLADVASFISDQVFGQLEQ